ncbi:EthD family reductase [Sphingomonas colocasiae]|uniref:EthD family reductase n=1 Tax=Sphingomonas colocasiae TaxID=1848973 RepID=A0ABS7PY23_9SPHN|nr:EthD family reductase [Sphingomonas colocasiae]MBY8826265.1 EthD family reductase [Sphingomonas colocasiae]
MATVSVIYPRAAGAQFDFDYYIQTHVPLVEARWGDAGLQGVQAFRGVAGPDGAEPPYFLIALVGFVSDEALAGALGGPHAAEIMGDIPNFTGVQPVIQVNEAL